MKASAARYETPAAELDAARVKGTRAITLGAYSGRYYWDTVAYFVDIALLENTLNLEFLGRDDQIYPLEHYHYDTVDIHLADDGRGISEEVSIRVSHRGIKVCL